MTSYVFDIETDGLLDTVSKIHCISVINVTVGSGCPLLFSDTPPNEHLPHDGSILDGISLLRSADVLIGHNIIGYDIPVIEKVTGVKLSPHQIYDTLIVAQLLFQDVPMAFYKDPKTGVIVSKKGHSLDAWGMRLHCYKSKIETDWKTYTEEMGLYCIQDSRVAVGLYKYLNQQKWPKSSIDFELNVAPIISSITNYGFYFDTENAIELYGQLLQKRQQLAEEARTIFRPWYKMVGEFIPKRDNLARGYIQGAKLTKIELTEFNPGSRAHIVDRIIHKYNWVPTDYTEKGHVIMDETTLASLPYPEAKGLSRLMMLDKRLGQLAEGDQAWLKLVKEDHRIHGHYNQNGTITGRCSHYWPNLSQVPSNRAEFGDSCRALFRAAPGKILVGCDYSGLEFAILAGYLAKYDGGALVHTVIHGDKALGTDVHSVNADLCGVSRDIAKTLIYAYLYGAGQMKLGATVDPTLSEAAMKALGADMRDRLSTGIVGLKELSEVIRDTFRSRGRKILNEEGKQEYIDGWLTGLDGRKLKPRYEYQALNTLIQSAGALITKRGLVEFINLMSSQGLTHGKEYGIVVYSHDEIVVETRELYKEVTKKCALEAVKLSGEYFNFPCPMSGECKEGLTWSEVH